VGAHNPKKGDEKMERTVAQCEKGARKRTLLGGLLCALLVTVFSVALIGEFSTAEASPDRLECYKAYKNCKKSAIKTATHLQKCRLEARSCYEKCNKTDHKGMPSWLQKP